jgi:lipoyl(octanoyl) transferase
MHRAERLPDELWVCHMGLVPYSDSVAMQGQLCERRQAGELPDVLLLLEHPPTYTHGRRAGAEELPFDEDHYRALGIEVHPTDRGGRVTYHGPGQLVGYPIMGVEDVGRHVRKMEAAIVAAVAAEGLSARARVEDGPDYTGVWVDERKLASIGVHVSRGVSTHGFAVNVDNDLEPFSWVIACGLPDVTMTSLARELGRGPLLHCFRKRMAHSFCQEHDRRQRLVGPARLGLTAASASAPVPAWALVPHERAALTA